MGYVHIIRIAPSSNSKNFKRPALIQTPSLLIAQQYQNAYDWYPYYYKQTPGFMEVPSPRLVPKAPASPGENSLPGTETEPDNNPSEDSHDEELPERQKRDDVVGGFNPNNNKVAATSSTSSIDKIIVDNNIGGQTWSNNPVNSGGADLMQYMADRRIFNPGRPKNLETCEEEYLLERQVAPKKKYDRPGGGRSPI